MTSMQKTLLAGLCAVAFSGGAYAGTDQNGCTDRDNQVCREGAQRRCACEFGTSATYAKCVVRPGLGKDCMYGCEDHNLFSGHVWMDTLYNYPQKTCSPETPFKGAFVDDGGWGVWGGVNGREWIRIHK